MSTGNLRRGSLGSNMGRDSGGDLLDSTISVSSFASDAPSEASNVQAMVRVRPFDANREGDFTALLSVVDNRVDVLDPEGKNPPQAFDYDTVFWSVNPEQTREKTPFSSQEDVFKKIGTSTLESIWNGFNVCIFAYGQTGSGKTYTMMGSEADPGLVPRICDALIAEKTEKLTKQTIDADQVTFSIKIEARYYEIYNEKVQDLLASLRKNKANTKSSDLKVRNHPVHGPFVEGCEAVEVATSADILKLLEVGNSERTVAATKMNDRSSRSHALFRLQVTQIWTQNPQGANQKPTSSERIATLNLVDLAGSERIKASGVSGVELTQATNINLSLTTLRRVIDALIEQSKAPRSKIKIPYRESVLTFLLSTNLGGNSKTTMIATVSPHVAQSYETLNTLNYAMRAKAIVCSVRVNEDSTAKVLADLQSKFNMLQDQQASLTEEEIQEKKAQLESLQQAMEEIQTREKEQLAQAEVIKEELNKEKTKRIASLFQSKVRSVVVDNKTQELQDKFAKEKEDMKFEIEKLKEDYRVKEQAFLDQQKKDQIKSDTQQVKDSKKRQELQNKIKELEDTLGKRLDEIARLREFEEEYRRTDSELTELKKKRAIEQLKYESDMKQQEAQSWDLRRRCEALAAEVADIKCQTSIVEHKLSSEKAKVGYQDQMQEDLVRYKNQVDTLQITLTQTQSSMATERLRFEKNIKTLEERISKLHADLEKERQGVNRVQLAETFQAALTRSQSFLKRALEFCSRRSGSVFAPAIDDAAQIEVFLERIEANDNSHTTVSENVDALNLESPVEFGDLENLLNLLQRLPAAKQRRLLSRMTQIVMANITNSAPFGLASGILDRGDDNPTLVNCIANLTKQNEMLRIRLHDLSLSPSAPTTTKPSGAAPITPVQKYTTPSGEVVSIPVLSNMPSAAVRQSNRLLRDVRTQETKDLLQTDGGIFTIGRMPGVHLFLDSENVSRTHAVIKCNAAPDAPVVVDLGSSRGTFVNGVRIHAPTPLKSKDNIAFGSTNIAYVFEEEHQIFVDSQATPLATSRSLATSRVVATARSQSAAVLSPKAQNHKTPPETPRDTTSRSSVQLKSVQSFRPQKMQQATTSKQSTVTNKIGNGTEPQTRYVPVRSARRPLSKN